MNVHYFDPALLISGTKDAFCNMDLLKSVLSKRKPNSSEVQLVTIEGGDHSYKSKGGKAVVEDNLKLVCKSAVNFAKKIFGLSPAFVPEENTSKPEPDKDAVEEVVKPAKRAGKRKSSAKDDDDNNEDGQEQEVKPPASKRAKKGTLDSFVKKSK